MKKRYIILLIIIIVFFLPLFLKFMENKIYAEDVNNYPMVCADGLILNKEESCNLQTNNVDYVNARCPWKFLFFWHPTYITEVFGGALKAKDFSFSPDAFSVEEDKYTNFCNIVSYKKLVPKKEGSYEVTYIYSDNRTRHVEIVIQ